MERISSNKQPPTDLFRGRVLERGDGQSSRQRDRSKSDVIRTAAREYGGERRRSKSLPPSFKFSEVRYKEVQTNASDGAGQTDVRGIGGVADMMPPVQEFDRDRGNEPSSEQRMATQVEMPQEARRPERNPRFGESQPPDGPSIAGASFVKELLSKKQKSNDRVDRLDRQFRGQMGMYGEKVNPSEKEQVNAISEKFGFLLRKIKDNVDRGFFDHDDGKKLAHSFLAYKDRMISMNKALEPLLEPVTSAFNKFYVPPIGENIEPPRVKFERALNEFEQFQQCIMPSRAKL
jgi:hypothetical protein